MLCPPLVTTVTVPLGKALTAGNSSSGAAAAPSAETVECESEGGTKKQHLLSAAAF